MRKLVTLAPARARTFGEILDGEGIEHRVDEDQVWVLKDGDLDQARDLLLAWEDDPDAARFVEAQDRAAARRAERAAEDRRLAAVKARIDRAERPIGVGPVTIAVLAACAGITLLGIPSLTALGQAVVGLPALDNLLWAFLDVPRVGERAGDVPFLDEVASGQVWRLLTPIFVHVGGLLHLFFNGYWFWHFGRQIETRMGSLYLAILVVLLGVASNLAQYGVGYGLVVSELAPLTGPYVLGPVYLGGPYYFGGLSGVLYGLFGFIWAKSALDKFSGLGLPSSTVAILMIWLLICFSGAVGPIANLAHLGGLVAGVLWGAVSHRLRATW